MPAPFTAGRPRPARPAEGHDHAAFIRSVMPALDLAFGLERPDAVPEAIAALVARLDAGPLGRSGGPSSQPADWSAGVTAEAA